MSTTNRIKPVAIALGAVAAIGLGGSQVAQAAPNPFGMAELDQGYMLAMEGKCGSSMKHAKEGKCGAGKMKAKKEGKCGEGKCGANKMKMKMKHSKEGKCGNMK